MVFLLLFYLHMDAPKQLEFNSEVQRPSLKFADNTGRAVLAGDFLHLLPAHLHEPPHAHHPSRLEFLFGGAWEVQGFDRHEWVEFFDGDEALHEHWILLFTCLSENDSILIYLTYFDNHISRLQD